MWVLPSMIDVPDARFVRCRHGAVRHQVAQDPAALSPKVGFRFRGALVASVAGLSLTHTVGKAVWTGLVHVGKPFPAHAKMRRSRQFQPGCCGGVAGAVLLALLLMAMISMGFDRGFRTRRCRYGWWMLGVQSLPYLATMVTARISRRSNRTPDALRRKPSRLPQAA
jgi:hypothetical protein